VTGLSLIVLDLDGTIYSSRVTTLGAVERAVRDLNARHGLAVPVPSEREILGGIGSNRAQFAEGVFPRLPVEYHDDLDALIWHWEHALIVEGKGSLFAGAREALADLAADGFRLAMATNAGEGYMDTVLDHFDLRRFFELARCAGANPVGDKGDLLRGILDSLAVAPGSAAMVGDRASDVRAARKAGTRAVGCTWGFGAPSELGDADRIIGGFGELAPLARSWR